MTGVATLYKDLAGIAAEFAKTHDRSRTLYVVHTEPQEQWKAVTTSHEMDVGYHYSTTWLGSTKDIVLRATYTVQAGVDLSKVKYEFDDNTVLVHNADGIIISCEQKDLRQVNTSGGVMNHIQDGDLERAQNALHETARKQALESGILKTASEVFIKKIQELPQAGDHGFEFKRALPEDQ